MPQMVDVRRDWTPADKRMFEDIAIEFIEDDSRAQYDDDSYEIDRFTAWLNRKHPFMAPYESLIWSYVRSN